MSLFSYSSDAEDSVGGADEFWFHQSEMVIPDGVRVTKPQYLTLGKNLDIAPFTYINAAQGVTIEDDVMIGPQCSILTVNTIDHTMGEIIIKRGAKIGAHSVILPRKEYGALVIGEGAKCGAYSLIKESVKPGTEVLGGNHAVKARL